MFESTQSTIHFNKALSRRVHIRNRIPPEINLFPGIGFVIFLIQNNIKWFVIRDQGLRECEGFKKKPDASVAKVSFILQIGSRKRNFFCKKFPTFYATRRFITMFARVCHFLPFLIYTNSVHNFSPHNSKKHLKFILLATPKISLKFFTSSFPTRNLCSFLFCPIRIDFTPLSPTFIL